MRFAPRPRAAAAALLTALVLVTGASDVAAQSPRVRVVEGQLFTRRRPATPPLPQAGEASLLALACRRDTTRRRAPTRCRVVEPRSLAAGGLALASVDRCYAASGAPLTRPDGAVVAEVVRAFEASHDASDTVAVALPANAGAVLVVVQWTDTVLTERCVRWSRRCDGLDCNMIPPGQRCVASVTVRSRQQRVEWGRADAGTGIALVARSTEPAFLESGTRLVRFESVALGPADAGTARATIGARDRAGLVRLASETRDPVARYAAWVNLAVGAWLAADEAALADAAAHAAGSLADALAAATPAARVALGEPAATLARAVSYLRGGSLRPPCEPRPD